MKYKLIAFDFDGTLADSFPFFMSVFDSLADTHGFLRIDRNDLHNLRGHDARALMRHVGLPLWKFPQVGMDFKARMAASIDRIALFEGVTEMLQTLHARGMRLAVVTSNSRENVVAVLGAQNAALIDDFECGVSLFGKRHKLRQLLKHSGLQGKQMLYVGDELRDAEAARDESLAFGAVAWGYARFDVLQAQSPAMQFACVADIVAQLDQA